MRVSLTLQILRFIVGRHDLPFYYSHSAKLQLSFLDAFLKDNDYDGWKSGKQSRVNICVRKGNCGVDVPSKLCLTCRTILVMIISWSKSQPAL